jgi:hypothetical protein
VGATTARVRLHADQTIAARRRPPLGTNPGLG